MRVKIDVEMECYSGEHITWCAIAGVPMLFIWGIGAPILALAVMLKYKKSLNEWNVQKYLLVLYQGLKLERFYWELINTARKTLLL